MYAGWMLDAAKAVADRELEWSKRDDGCNAMDPRRAGGEGCWGGGGGGRGGVTTPSRVSQGGLWEGEQQVGLVSSRLSSPHLSQATIQVHVDDAKGETEDEDEALTPLYIVPILLPVHQRIIRIQTTSIKASDGCWRRH
ncbi:hypothetical protein K438DRAFT_1774874 [Mycena galopus ATCC 62051]|nr:hypothetical protein K438DRAFT_1774874 [Mycena galopus ATCC 62051]